MLEAVIACVDRQREAVELVRRHCEELDGTKLQVIPVTDDGCEGTNFPTLQAHGFHQVAAQMDKPFIWLEADSVPLKPGWRQALSEEYRMCGKKFMISSDTHPPFDIVGGIGVYPAESKWLLPRVYGKQSWDRWIIDVVPHLVHRTPMIQHKYAIYDESGKAVQPHVFPRDAGLIRHDALIFHRDKYLSLLNTTAQNVFLHHGDLGDIIAFLAVIKSLGGGKIVLSPSDNNQREGLRGRRFDAIRPLLEAQEYVSGVEWSEYPLRITHDTTGFRRIVNASASENLISIHARYLGVQSPTDPWLNAQPSPLSYGKTIAARTPRYNNPVFPWKTLAAKRGDDWLFVGLPEEHQDFEREVCRQINYAPTKTLLDVAELIAGSRGYIGGQSSPCWIALGLGVEVIQETCPWAQTAIVNRHNAWYILSHENVRAWATSW